MKLDFNISLLNLEDLSWKDENGNDVILGKQIAPYFSNSAKNDPLKMYDWARALFQGKALDLDKSDQKVFTDFIEKHETMPNFLKCQAQNVLDKKPETPKVEPE